MLFKIAIPLFPVVPEVQFVDNCVSLAPSPDLNLATSSNGIQIKWIVQIRSEAGKASPIGQGI